VCFAFPPEKLKSLIESTLGGLQMSVGGLKALMRYATSVARETSGLPRRHFKGALWLSPDADRRTHEAFCMSDGRTLNGHFRFALSLDV
jgi:hypothetical protein